MRRNKVFTGLALVIVALVVGACSQRAPQQTAAISKTPTSAANTDSHADHSNHNAKPKKPVPAFQSEESAKDLKPTLSPAMFKGTVSAAYAAVKEIPETIAQLPCYCRCDRSIGHKSLHSCFEDDHGANCGICMNSALKAYKLQKEQKLSPAQIRESLNAEYANY